jgi:hypothetical protein
MTKSITSSDYCQLLWRRIEILYRDRHFPQNYEEEQLLLGLVKNLSYRRGQPERKQKRPKKATEFLKFNYLLRGLLTTLPLMERFLISKAKRDPHRVRVHLLRVGNLILDELYLDAKGSEDERR